MSKEDWKGLFRAIGIALLLYTPFGIALSLLAVYAVNHL